MRFWRVIEPYIGFLLQGFALTVAACLLAVIGAVLLGALTASMRSSGNRLVRGLANVYGDVFRNVPFLVQLFFFFYGLPELGIYIGAFETGVIALSIAGGAFVSDVLGFEPEPANVIAALGDQPERLTVVEGTLEATLDAVAAFSGRH